VAAAAAGADELLEGAGRRESLPPFTPQTLPQPLLQPPMELGPPLPPPSLFSPLPALEGTEDARSAAVGTDDAPPAAAVAPARNSLRGWLLSTSPGGASSSGR